MKKTPPATSAGTLPRQIGPINPAIISPQLKEALQQIGIVNPETITTKQAADYLTRIKGVPTAPSSLSVYRCQSRGPRYRKIMSRVYYSLGGLDTWAEGVEVQIYDPSRVTKEAAA